MIKSITQIQHLQRFASQHLRKPDVGIIGGYHGGNLGDIALGESVRQLLLKKNVHGGLQTIYNLEKWPKTEFAIVGGGAVGYVDSLRRVALRYKGDFGKVALLGVDFNERNYPEDCVELIRGAAYVSCRSEQQSITLKEISGREDISYHPDIAFSLYPEYCLKQRSRLERRKKVLINVVPLYGGIIKDKVVPIEDYRKERPELYENFEQMQLSYQSFVRNIVTKAIENNYIVATIPFTNEDEVYSRLIFKGLPVEHYKYHSNPQRMFETMAEADQIVATRYHATIFALKLGLKLTPIAYATKNELLLKELGIDRKEFLSTGDLASGINNIETPYVQMKTDILDWENRSIWAIEACINSLGIA